jgi:thymidylate kinase
MFVTFSGIDCCGKSTQIALLEQWLRARARRPLVLWVRPGYTPGFQALKNAARRLLGKAAPPAGESAQRRAFMGSPLRRRLWLTVALFDLALLCALRLRWHKLTGRAVICDRYLDDAELDFAMNFPEDDVPRRLGWRLLRRLARRPDHAFLLHIPFEESLRRARTKQEPFGEDDDRRRRRYQLYQHRQAEGAWQVVEAMRSIEEIHHELVRRVQAPAAAARVAGAGERR